jgi:Heliorhodopsin
VELTTERGLRRTNVVAGILHLVQGIAILVLSNAFALPVKAAYMAGPPGSSKPRQVVQLFEIRTAWAIAAFFFLSAFFHLAIAGPWWKGYVRNLDRQRNPYRWVEYSLSASIMIVVIAQLTGIEDVAALVALFGVNASMIGFGWIQERYEEPGGSLTPFWLGCGAGIVPWLAIGIYLAAPGAHEHAPGFVYGIYFSLFVFFNIFALTQWLQYRKVGRYRDYLVGERTYLILSLVAKSLLAWQVFAATLAPSN